MSPVLQVLRTRVIGIPGSRVKMASCADPHRPFLKLRQMQSLRALTFSATTRQTMRVRKQNGNCSLMKMTNVQIGQMEALPLRKTLLRSKHQAPFFPLYYIFNRIFILEKEVNSVHEVLFVLDLMSIVTG